MTPRLVMLWLCTGAQAIMIACGLVSVICVALAVVLSCGARATPDRDLAIVELSIGAVRAGGLAILSVFAWVFLHSIISAFNWGEHDPAP